MAIIKISLIIAITLISVIYSMPVNDLISHNEETNEDINDIIDYDDAINNYRSRAIVFAGALPGAMKLPHNHKDVQTAVKQDSNGKKVFVLYRPSHKKGIVIKESELELNEVPDLLPENPEQLIGPKRIVFDERMRYGRLITTPATEEINYHEASHFRCPNGHRLTKRGSCRQIW